MNATFPLRPLIALALLAVSPAWSDDGGVHEPDGGAPTGLVPPSLRVDSPAAYPDEPAVHPAQEVQLELVITETGEVESAHVVGEPDARFADAALHAAAGLQFEPATLDGQPVSVRAPFVYRFEARAPPPQTGVLSGVVRAKGSRLPVPSASLSVDGQATPIEVAPDGRFRLELPPGKTWVRVSAPGYRPGAFSEEIRANVELKVEYAIEPTTVTPYETIVIGQRERTEVASVQLREQEIREVPGTMGDPFRVIMLMPGVSSLGSGLSYPVVRGTQPAATGYFIDGVRVPQLFHLLLGSAVIHPDFVDGIDFFPGAPPARYGRLLGGAVEGVLSRPRDDRLHGTAYADLLNAGLFVETPIQKTKTNFTLAGRLSYSPLLLALAANTVLPADVPMPVADFADYQARVEQALGATRLRLLAFGSSDIFGARPRNEQQQGGHLGVSFHRVDLRARHPVGRGEAELGATWGIERIGLFGEQGSRRLAEFSLNQRNVMVRGGYSLPLSEALELKVGADVEHHRGQIVFELGEEGANAAVIPLPLALATYVGGYVEATWKPTERWVIVPGLRADNYYLTPRISEPALEPRLSARYALTERVTLKAGGGLYHQPPTLLIPIPVADIAGLNQGLQQAVQLDLGVETKLPKNFEGSVDVYYNPLLRTVDLDLERVFNRQRLGARRIDQSTSGASYGFELLLRKPLSDRWFGWVSYSFNQSVRHQRFVRYDDSGVPAQVLEGDVAYAFRQAHVVNLALSYQLASGWTLGTVLHLNTGRPETGEIASRTQRRVDTPTGPTWVLVDRDRVDDLPPFWRVDARVSRTFTFNDFTLQAYLDVFNLGVSFETFGYNYLIADPFSGTDFRKEAVSFPVVAPMLGLKGTY